MATRTTPCLAKPTPDVLGDAARAAREPAPVDPDHHGQIRARPRSRDARRSGTDNLPTASRGAGAPAAPRRGGRSEASLHTVRAEFRSPGARPSTGDGLGRPPAQLADRRRRERNAFEGGDSVGDHALKFAAIDLHDRSDCTGDGGRRRRCADDPISRWLSPRQLTPDHRCMFLFECLDVTAGL